MSFFPIARLVLAAIFAVEVGTASYVIRAGDDPSFVLGCAGFVLVVALTIGRN